MPVSAKEPVKSTRFAPILRWLQLATATLVLAPSYLLAQAYNETILYSFGTAPSGADPESPLTAGPDGSLYGTTKAGGATNNGTIFRVDPNGQLNVLYSFQGGSDGSEPSGALIFDPSGNLYGTTGDGGTANDGTIFRLSATGRETVLYSFPGHASGATPQTGVIRDQAGNLYGTTAFGGEFQDGCVFKLDLAGNETVLYNFPVSEAGTQGPGNGLIMDSAGALYGTTQGEGATIQGSVYTIDRAGNETTLYNFSGVDGASPEAALIRDSEGNLYGTTAGGGAYNSGVVFKLTPTGKETVLYSFTGDADGGIPQSNLLPDSSGNLYGTTFFGGSAGKGVLFKLSATGFETVLANFGASQTSPANPAAGVVRDASGNFFGTTIFGGFGQGVVYRVSAAGQATNIYAFPSDEKGVKPVAGVVRDAAGNLYGSTYAGGLLGQGVIYKFETTGKLTILHSFTGGNGGNGPGGLALDTAGNIFGTTFMGGAGSAGVVFEITASGQYSVLHSFTGGTDGGSPSTGVTLGGNGNLYGVTTAGGASNHGVVYKIDLTGKETVLYSFLGGTDGSYPVSNLILDGVGNIYGTTGNGGTSNGGTVFSLTPSGQETVLHRFTNGSDGVKPTPTIARDVAGNIYGTTEFGGTNQSGVIYVVSPTQQEKILYTFDGLGGSMPVGGVMLDREGHLFGTTFSGGSLGGGVVFELSPSGTETVVFAFDQFGATGSGPESAPLLDNSGSIYGTTISGGAYQNVSYAGVLYKLTPN